MAPDDEAEAVVDMARGAHVVQVDVLSITLANLELLGIPHATRVRAHHPRVALPGGHYLQVVASKHVLER
eukprot:CAMPEP_0181178090 /NCGR_PEP_ID=MMETSP1096-20121128/5529_1 /TAXON_ID=156174 ORGANISM="Chrysochromulina ericina, Strain CCMP281" /NCGR_SAMPLE_ID=MMETSP1096 /ASSEMBLY_ACC=CAM_ASM_000453 /LENGTH=69 /DNA_ID=CAMNT_0023266325 /DNA_START=1308 /DNA_END=1514 /DNA_ORIENTATION=+